MIRNKKPMTRPAYALEKLRPTQLGEIIGWLDEGVARSRCKEDALVVTERMHTALLHQYGPRCQGKKFQSHVMMVNRVPVFCATWLHGASSVWKLRLAGSEAHMYLLCRPEVARNSRLLLLAWQAATVHTFLKMEFSRVRTAVLADRREENEVLRLLGYRLMETAVGPDGRINVYICKAKDLQIVM